jgi:hypothetical protein
LICSTLLLAIVAATACERVRGPEIVAAASTFQVCWPLGRSGNQRVLLDIPRAYGTWEPSSRSEQVLSNRDIHAVGFKCEQRQLLLQALWPGLEPNEPAIRGEMSVGGGGRMMMMLLSSSAVESSEGLHYDSLQSAFDIAVNWSAKDLCLSPLELHNYAPGARTKCYPRAAPDSKAPEFGLDRLGVDFQKYPDIPEKSRYGMAEQDIYYQRGADGKLQVVILCNAEEASSLDAQLGMVSQCQHKFIIKPLNALTSINYRRVYLKDWKAIQNSWEKLLTSLVVDETSNSSLGK